MQQQASGTYVPGTILRINGAEVIVERYLAEGGFAHVYVVRVGSSGLGPAALMKGELVVLKRLICHDKDQLNTFLNEIQVMKIVDGHRNIVRYYDSSVQKSRADSYEISILMEYCARGHLVDFLNTRLNNRLSDKEVLTIFISVASAIARMHYLKTPVLHRDIKVENVLISSDRVFKLCDFGSSTSRIILPGAVSNVREIQALEDEIGKHTTIHYRAPEICDLYQRKGMNEKVDIWALGVFLYKLCFFITPFETGGQLAILNVKYQIPSLPQYPKAIISMIESMLAAEPADRPNIYYIIETACKLMNISCPISNIYKDFYSTSSPTGPTAAPAAAAFIPAATPVNVPSSIPGHLTDANALSYRSPTPPDALAAVITPMRRGRPSRPTKIPLDNNVSSGDFARDNSGNLDAGLEDAEQKKSTPVGAAAPGGASVMPSVSESASASTSASASASAHTRSYSHGPQPLTALSQPIPTPRSPSSAFWKTDNPTKSSTDHSWRDNASHGATGGFDSPLGSAQPSLADFDPFQPSHKSNSESSIKSASLQSLSFLSSSAAGQRNSFPSSPFIPTATSTPPPPLGFDDAFTELTRRNSITQPIGNANFTGDRSNESSLPKSSSNVK